MDSDSSDEPVPRDRSERDEDAQPAFVLGTASFSSSSTRNAKVHRAPPKNFGAFEKHTKGIGLKLLLKMGYSPGQGLGADGSGISAPIDVKLRPKGMGIGHGGFDERPKSVIAQSKKDTVDVDDHPEPRWRKKSRRRIFMTAQELIAEQDSLPVPSIAEPISTKIRDMTGSVPKLIDLANLAEKPIPELVHNIQLLSSMSKTSLLHLARQIKIETKNMAKERGNLQALQDYLVISKSKLHTAQDIHILLSECKDNQQLVFGLDQVHLIYGGVLDQLLESHLPQVKSLSLDTHITALLCPVFKTAFKDWSLFQDPSRGLPILKDYRRLIVRFGTGSMSPYEAMMYNYWLPCVRHTINNDWNPHEPESLVEFLTMWYGKDTKSRFIPPWLFQNVIHQLVFPKISEAVDICTDKDVVRIHLWLFPWLPLLGSELDFLWSEIRRKIEHLFKNQPFINPIIFDTISIWNPVFSESDMQHLAKSVIIPGIISQLSLLQIDPQNQDVSMLQATFQWQPFLPAHQLSLIFETEFFPKWHTALWSWITFPHARLDEISQWYCHWKTFLAEAGLASLDSVKKGFSIGLDMMNQGLSLTPGSTPVFVGSSAKAPVASITDNQLTFLDLVQLSCADANVDFVPLNRRHANGRAMYKLGLLTVYLENGVMFVNGPGGYTPSSIEAAILRSGM